MFGVNRELGFTLVEVMVALAISGIVLASIYSAFQSQQNSYVAQEQVSEMQQNVRVGLDMLTRDIRLAGYNRSGLAGAGFVTGDFFYGEAATTNATQLAFTADLDDDGGIDAVPEDVDGNGSIDMSDMEQVAYSLNGTDLQRLSSGGTWQTVAEHVENLEFQYILDNGTQTTAPTAAQLDNIRNVRVSILVSTEMGDRNFINTEVYLPASNDPFFTSAANLTGTVWGPFTGTATVNFRRRLLKITVNCRNMGL
jgi:type IV pilus assembly protein PilW